MFFETTLTAERLSALTTAGAFTDRLLNDSVDEWARSAPLKTAIVDRRSRYSYAELRARVRGNSDVSQTLALLVKT